VSGAADLESMRQFWGYASRGALEWLNENAEDGARIHFQNTTQGAVDMYRREGWLREDLRSAWSVDTADYFLLHHQKSFAPLHYDVWERFDTRAPVFTVNLHGVPMLSVYENTRRASDREAREASTDEATNEPIAIEGDAGPEGSGDDAPDGSGDADDEGSGVEPTDAVAPSLLEGSGALEPAGEDPRYQPSMRPRQPVRQPMAVPGLRMPGLEPGL
jgi:hypothetical protein